MFFKHRAADTSHPHQLSGSIPVDHERTGQVQRLEYLFRRDIGWVKPDGKGQFVIFYELPLVVIDFVFAGVADCATVQSSGMELAMAC